MDEEDKKESSAIIPSSLFFNPTAIEKAKKATDLLTGERLITRIQERLEDVPEKELTKIDDVGVFEGFTAGIIDGAIKLPYGFVTLAAEVKDALGGLFGKKKKKKKDE